MQQIVLWLLIVGLTISVTPSSSESCRDESDDYEIESPRQERRSCVTCMRYYKSCTDDSECLAGWEKCFKEGVTTHFKDVCDLIKPIPAPSHRIPGFNYSICNYVGYEIRYCNFREFCAIQTPCPRDFPQRRSNDSLEQGSTGGFSLTLSASAEKLLKDDSTKFAINF